MVNQFQALTPAFFSRIHLLKGSEVKVFMYLLYRAPRIYPKQSTIAKDLEIGIATVIRAIKGLREKNFIKMNKFYKTPSVYEIQPEFLIERVKAKYKQAAANIIQTFHAQAKRLGHRFWLNGAHGVSETIQHNQRIYIKNMNYIEKQRIGNVIQNLMPRF